MHIRREQISDLPGIRVVNEVAFKRLEEADLVDRLRQNCPESLSLVAVDQGRVVGHVLFTPVTLTGGGQSVAGMGLAPLAVLPERQGQGIGSRLVHGGLEILQERACPYVIVLGHADYYPRFGFEPASRYGIRCQWENIPEDAFMVLIFDSAALKGVTGVAYYRDEFNEAM